MEQDLERYKKYICSYGNRFDPEKDLDLSGFHDDATNCYENCDKTLGLLKQITTQLLGTPARDVIRRLMDALDIVETTYAFEQNFFKCLRDYSFNIGNQDDLENYVIWSAIMYNVDAAAQAAKEKFHNVRTYIIDEESDAQVLCDFLRVHLSAVIESHIPLVTLLIEEYEDYIPRKAFGDLDLLYKNLKNLTPESLDSLFAVLDTNSKPTRNHMENRRQREGLICDRDYSELKAEFFRTFLAQVDLNNLLDEFQVDVHHQNEILKSHLPVRTFWKYLEQQKLLGKLPAKLKSKRLNHEKLAETLEKGGMGFERALPNDAKSHGPSLETHGSRDTKPLIFISYAHDDVEIAKTLRDAITTASQNTIEIIFDEDSIRSGDRIEKFIHDSVAKADFILFLISKKSLLSYWVAHECITTISKEKLSNKEHFIACFTDKDLMDRFYDKFTTVQKDIARELNDTIRQAHSDIGDLQDLDQGVVAAAKWQRRLIHLRAHLDEIIEKLNEYKTENVLDESSFNESVERIVRTIMSRFSNDVGERSTSDIV